MAPKIGLRGPAATIILVLSVAAAGCSSTTPTASAMSSNSPAPIASSPTTSAAPTKATATPDPASFASDGRLTACGGLAAGIQAVVPLDHAWAYRSVMPGVGLVPQLDVAAGPALLVVYSGAVPEKLDWRTYVHRLPQPAPETTPSSPTPVPTLPPGKKNVCVALNATDTPQIIPEASVEPFRPELAGLAVRPAAPAGQARVIKRAAHSSYDLAWDPIHAVLWYTAQSQTDSALVRLDPATGKTTEWTLPANDNGGFFDMLVVDAAGAVWFDQRGVRLFRLDPASGKLAHLDIDTRIKPAVDDGGVWISAIAADGDGVLIARESLPYLTRIDASLHEAGRINLPNDYSGAEQLGVVGDDVVVNGRPGRVTIFSRQGSQVATAPIQFFVAVEGPARLLPAGDGEVAGVGGPTGRDLTVFDAAGRVVRTLPLTLDLPIGPFADTSGFESNPRPQVFTTDWHGRFWYTLGTYIVEVRTS